MQNVAVLSHLRPQSAYILGHYGHARSQGERQPAAAKPGLYISIPRILLEVRLVMAEIRNIVRKKDGARGAYSRGFVRRIGVFFLGGGAMQHRWRFSVAVFVRRRY